MIAKRLFLNHSPSEWFSFIQVGGQLLAARRMVLFVKIVIPGFIVLVILVFVIGRLGLAFFFLALF